MSSSKLKIATRGSQLALWQANWIRRQILERFPEVDCELIIIKTTGDRIQDRALSEIGGKGLFVKELEQALLDRTADIAVHSMKDMPGMLPDGLEISVVTRREHSGDALVAPRYQKLDDLPPNALVGTSSLRRSSQLKHYRPDLQIQILRGNVPTRLEKVRQGNFDATILAVAGLNRLELAQHITEVIQHSVMLPAIAQGIVGIESRIGDSKTLSYIQHLHHLDTADCLRAERTLLNELEGNCQVPLAGHCVLEGNQLHLDALVAQPDGKRVIRFQASDSRARAEELGKAVAAYLLEHGGKEILKELSC
ncbi:hydroxymethylbilane synthase [Deltaproteobacteria bacterium TL4]